MLEQKYISGKTAVNIARSIESAVAAGKIAVGEQLPSVRELSKHLGVAGATIAAAYRILQERGVRDLIAGNPDRELLPDPRRHLRKLKVRRRLYGEDLNDRDLIAVARSHFR